MEFLKRVFRKNNKPKRTEEESDGNSPRDSDTSESDDLDVEELRRLGQEIKQVVDDNGLDQEEVSRVIRNFFVDEEQAPKQRRRRRRRGRGRGRPRVTITMNRDRRGNHGQAGRRSGNERRPAFRGEQRASPARNEQRPSPFRGGRRVSPPRGDRQRSLRDHARISPTRSERRPSPIRRERPPSPARSEQRAWNVMDNPWDAFLGPGWQNRPEHRGGLRGDGAGLRQEPRGEGVSLTSIRHELEDIFATLTYLQSRRPEFGEQDFYERFAAESARFGPDLEFVLARITQLEEQQWESLEGSQGRRRRRRPR